MRKQSAGNFTTSVGETGGKGRARSGYRVGGWRIVQVSGKESESAEI